jgi:hypothetical protein
MEFVDLKSGARMFSLSKTTLRSLVRKGQLRSYRLSKNGKILFKPEDLKNLLNVKTGTQEEAHR